MHSTSLDIEINGSSRKFYYRADATDTPVIKSILQDREYDLARLRRGPDLVALYNAIVQSGKAPLILDVGANIGAAAIWFSGAFPDAKIVALEPEAENFALLQTNTAGLPVICRRAALSATPGRAKIVDPGYGAWGFRTARTDEVGEASVATMTVTDIYEEQASACLPFIVKIDIEGGEADVFSANTGWVAQTPLVIIELHDQMLPGQANSRSFLQCVAGLERDFVYVGENVFSIDVRLDRFAPVAAQQTFQQV